MMKCLVGPFIALGMTTSAAMAFEVTGGDVSLRFGHLRGSDGSWSQNDATGNLAFGFGNGFGAQIGLGGGTYDSGYSYRSAELHLTYQLPSGLTLGVMGGKESYGSFVSSLFYGVEAAYTLDKIKVDVAFTGEDSQSSAYFNRALQLDGTYALTDKIDVLAGWHYQDDNGTTARINYLYAGAQYGVTPALKVSATLGHAESNGSTETIATLGLTYAFGSGPTFHQRAYATLFPVD